MPTNAASRSSPVRPLAACEVRAPSRLHCGLFSFGHPTGPQYGGVGVMIDCPTLRLRAEPAERFTSAGPLAERVVQFADRWRLFHGLDRPPACRLEVLAAPDEHTGLGVGTQLGLSVAAALEAVALEAVVQRADMADLPPASLEAAVARARRLAASVGRGARSAIGAYGFVLGGLIVDGGKEPPEPLGRLEHRLALPPAWRVVLLRPREGRGLHGPHEREAFATLPAPAAEITAELRRLAHEAIVPAAAAGDFSAFGRAVHQFGRLAGGCFAARQGGLEVSPRLAKLVAWLRDAAVEGVGQSSWGPTLFAFAADEAAARDLAARAAAWPGEPLAIEVARPAATGAATLVVER